MPTLSVHRLHFHGGLHVGGPRDDPAQSLGVLPADTLFAALVDMWRHSGGDPVVFVAPFVAQPPNPPFLLTSAFPFAGDVRFYPMPVNRSLLFTETTLRGQAKEVRRIAYLSEALLMRALAGEKLDTWLFPAGEEEPKQGVALQGGRYWLTVEEIKQLPKDMRRQEGKRHALVTLKVSETTRTPRVTLDRLSSASQIYHVGRTTFAPACGLWFGVDWRAPDRPVGAGGPSYRAALDMLLALLADEGLGGDRASGYGALRDIETGGTATLRDVSPGDLAWLLSRYHPAGEAEYAALTHDRAAYSLVTVGGRLRSPDFAAARRRKLTLLGEGSLLPVASTPPVGDVADVRPRYAEAAQEFPHPVYRYGLALAAGRKEEAAHA